MRTSRLILLALITVAMSSGCTIIRPGDPPPGGGNNGDGPSPKVVDMLVLTQLDASAGNLAQDYSNLVTALEFELAERNVAVRQMAIAPLHRRAGEVVPLIYGRDDAGEFSSPQEAVLFYASDNGGSYLRDRASGEAENLAVLGLELDERAIYRPTSANPTARAYFQQAADGMVVLTFSASERLCAASEPNCELDGAPAADHFTATDPDGAASWLALPGTTKLAPDKIFHALFATAEGMTAAQFSEHCTGFPNFPSTYLDFMAPSQASFYSPMAQRISQRGGNARFVDLCKAFSSDADGEIKSLADQIKRMF